ncbi:hypothetical protein GIB67_029257 [Kingdonia uniflora]|uniref:DUF4283 domain-containing protein n=1 Tax=Kingdonia uniflora TaxID=39325 RepID=A0A7J7N949_9MAGN|nr:hypothetical protein GIB67_029257 [Kingdonia uniflora]
MSFKDGMPVISFSPSDLNKAAAAFNTTLVMSFPYVKPNLEVIVCNITSHWGLLTEPKVAMLDFKHIMVMLVSEKDAIRALSIDSGKIKGFFYKLAWWTVNFDPKKDSPFTPVWI